MYVSEHFVQNPELVLLSKNLALYPDTVEMCFGQT